MNSPLLPRQKHNVSWVIVLHIIVIILIWASSFLFRWQLVIIGVILNYLQIRLLGDCILTRRQFDLKKRNVTFHYFILIKMGFKPALHRVRFVTDYIIPSVLISIAIVWQLLLSKQPLVY